MELITTVTLKCDRYYTVWIDYKTIYALKNTKNPESEFSPSGFEFYSHSMVAGGLELIS